MNVEEGDSLHRRWRELLAEFKADFDKWEKRTLKEHIIRCAELVELKIDAKILDKRKESISSYLFHELNEKEGISVSDHYIRDVLPENFKRKYSDSELTSELRKKDWDVVLENQSDIIEKDQNGHFRINGREQLNKPIDEQDNQITIITEISDKPIENYHTKEHGEYFLEVAVVGKKLMDISREFKDKAEYDPNDNLTPEEHEKRKEQAQSFAEITQEQLPDPERLYKDIRSHRAELKHIGNLTDYRRKIGEFEKIKSIILCETTYNLAKVAKMLFITPKHQAHNIITNLETYLSNMKWFRSLIFKCRKCQAENVIELADWYNEQIERKELKLEMLDPT